MFVIPMMGKSRRFTEAGYALPKYRLPPVSYTHLTLPTILLV